MKYKSLSSFLWQFVRPLKWTFFLIGLFSLSWAIDATVWPYLLKIIVDIFTRFDLNRQAAWNALIIPICFGIGLWLLIDWSFRVMGFLMAKAFPKLEADMRMSMFDHVQRHSPKYFNDHFAGSLANKITDMTTQSVIILHQALTTFIPTFFACLLSIIFFAFINPLFALIVSCWLLLHFGFCCIYAKKCNAAQTSHGEARSLLLGKIVDSLTNNFTVNLFFRFKQEKLALMSLQNEEQSKNAFAKRQIEVLRVVLGLLGFFVGVFGINGLMIYFWLQGRISTGEAVQIFNMLWNILMLVWISGNAIPVMFQAIGIAKQALSIMNDPQDIIDSPNSIPLVVSKGEIRFENVTFSYGQNALFENKDVHIKGGEKVGLVGYSGAGKSTFINLILRFYPVKQGNIYIDDHEISTVTLESLRQQIALIPQDPLLFHRSLEDNIRIGKYDASLEEIHDAALLSHCSPFIEKLPLGFQTTVGERGTKLSGGERQRIAIARAILAKTPILILDEATSALDSVTERFIQENLEKIMNNRTTIVIAHRLSTLSKMDRILVFDRGKIIEEGTHNSLLLQNGHYAKMWQKQAGGFLPSQ